jgi:F420-0:gamma-glutamyl ligase-like protein
MAIKTRYWMPGDDYINLIVNAVKGKIVDGDVIAISEKPLAVAMGRLVNEAEVKPTRLSKLFVLTWTRILWAYILGPLCRLRWKSIQHLRKYPLNLGAKHKQVTLRLVGFLHALSPFSEGGIDASNVPYQYACLPLPNASHVADHIRKEVKKRLGKDVLVLILDTDKTYSIRNLHLSTRETDVKGIKSLGFLAYVLGRTLKLKRRSTPVALAGSLPIDEVLNVAELANKACGSGAGRTVWDMADKFGVGLTDVTWKMLQSIEHRPMAIVRRQKLDSRYGCLHLIW